MLFASFFIALALNKFLQQVAKHDGNGQDVRPVQNDVAPNFHCGPFQNLALRRNENSLIDYVGDVAKNICFKRL